MRSATMLACLAFVACSSQPAFDPGSGALYRSPTILVTNAACVVNACPPFQLYELFPSLCPLYPGGPGGDGQCVGSYLLAQVSASPTCLLLPDSVTVGEYSGGTADSITLVAVYPGASYETSPYVTTPFIPQEAPGWSVTLPGSNVDPPSPEAESKACSPAIIALP
jgi:hypothetical protein